MTTNLEAFQNQESMRQANSIIYKNPRINHSLRVDKSCQVLKDKKLILSAISLLPDDIVITSIYESMSKDVIYIDFTSRELNTLPTTYNIVQETSLKLKSA